ncbi:MAG: ATP-binding protein [Methanobacteriota archaeon]
MDAIYHVMNPWWEGNKFDSGIKREHYLNAIMGRINRKQIEVISGSRRVGKTTLLKQIIRHLLDGDTPPERILYLQLDHPQLATKTILEHLKEFRKHFGHGRDKKLFLLLDEIQETRDWETYLKAVYDTENVKLVCTGSTASLLKSQGGRLTGRQMVTLLYTLDFSEYLTFINEKPRLSEDYKYEKLAEDYLSMGGYPENVLEPSSDYLQNLLEDILARDLIRLYSLKKPWLLKELLQLIAASLGSRISYNKMANTLETTVDTVKEYAGYLEAAYLIKPLEKYSTSHADRIYSSKKIYFMDTGFKTLITGEGDIGAKAENAAYLKLLKDGGTCGYYAESEREVDFIYKKKNQVTPIEVKYLSSFDWEDKRYNGLRLYLRRRPDTKRIQVISKDVEEETRENKVTIKVTPMWKFLLNKL